MVWGLWIFELERLKISKCCMLYYSYCVFLKCDIVCIYKILFLISFFNFEKCNNICELCILVFKVLLKNVNYEI